MTSNLEKKPRLMEGTNVIKRINPIPIVGEKFTEDIPLCEAFIGILRRKQDTAVAMKMLINILPGFGHLKRCSEGRLLLTFLTKCETAKNDAEPSFDSSETLKNFLASKNFNLSLLEDEFKIIKVPERQPKTKLQALEAAKSWPLNFHPDPYMESILSGKFFDDQQLEVIEKCMKICIEANAKAVGNSNCTGSAVILNPNYDGGKIQLLAVAASRINEHPMWHASMLAVDLVAKNQGGGAWKLDKQTSSVESSLIDDRKRKLESQLPLCYPESLKEELRLPEFTNVTDFLKSNEKFRANKNDDVAYLCTNYWIFLWKEPCPLCAMALLHSRVSTIFYNVANEARGVLGSRTLLHTLPGLNHRYQVWSVILETNSNTSEVKMSPIEH